MFLILVKSGQKAGTIARTFVKLGKHLGSLAEILLIP